MSQIAPKINLIQRKADNEKFLKGVNRNSFECTPKELTLVDANIEESLNKSDKFEHSVLITNISGRVNRFNIDEISLILLEYFDFE